MKTVLVVEDEKMIRQGIKTIIQRSDVPVETIIECNNGETALEILQKQKIDVMFTDIRMPKMDGIELVKQIQHLENRPLIVAVSGYDDFSYAVEMMRHGVKEYILKPVERQKVQAVLKKLQEEIEQIEEIDHSTRKLAQQQLKYIMLNTNITQEELELLEKEYSKLFVEGNYYVCCMSVEEELPPSNNYILLKNLDCNNVCIVEEKELQILLKNELSNGFVGISAVHRGLENLREAFAESEKARRCAFAANHLCVRYGEGGKRIPEQLVEESKKLLGSEACLQRVQLLGTDKTEEVSKIWNVFFHAVKSEHLSDVEFEQAILEFLNEASKTYRNVISSQIESPDGLREMWKYKNIDEYEEVFMDWILRLHETINNQFDTNKNKQKIQQAVEYIKANYAKDLNMAVVSNSISMNYSLFSYSFKQYTGSNFVNYLKNIRMDEAKKLLAETEMRVIEVSQAVGYDNEKHFMKIFKSACGVSPSEYRKNMKMTQEES